MMLTGTAPAAVALAAAVLVAPQSRRPWTRRPTPSVRPRRRCRTEMIAGFVVLAGIAATARPTVAAALLIAGATAALLRHRHRQGQIARDEAHWLGGALEVLVGELRVGAHPVCALETTVAECAPSPVTAVLHTVAARARLGADVAAALGLAAEAPDGSTRSQLWNRLAVYWRLGEANGLPVSTLMSAAQRDIRERRRFAARTHAAMAGARTSALLLATLPVLGIVMGELIGAGPIAFLAGGGIGGAVLVAGVVLISAGLLWADRLTRAQGVR